MNQSIVALAWLSAFALSAPIHAQNSSGQPRSDEQPDGTRLLWKSCGCNSGLQDEAGNARLREQCPSYR